MPPESEAKVAALVERRIAGEPVARILGEKEFWGLAFKLTRDTLVPRPDSETVVAAALAAVDQTGGRDRPLRVLDLGTGSGAIALAMATEVPHARVYAVENSREAFVWTRRNIEALGGDNISGAFADLADAFPELDGTVDVVISNPPYVPAAAVPRDPEVRLFDPAAALYGGEDGLDVVRVISRVAQRLLHPGGTLVLEHGELQGADIRAILTADGWRAAATHRDLTTRDRATTALR